MKANLFMVMVINIQKKIIIKIYKGSLFTNFHNKIIPKENVPCKCLSIMILDSVIKAYGGYHPQTSLNANMKKKR